MVSDSPFLGTSPLLFRRQSSSVSLFSPSSVSLWSFPLVFCFTGDHPDPGVLAPPTDSQSAAATANRRLATPAPSAT